MRLGNNEDHFFMVYGAEQSIPRFRHPTLEEATREAKRLAMGNPGIKFYVLIPASVHEHVAVHSRSLVNLDDIIPF